jgi:hypothetical protein
VQKGAAGNITVQVTLRWRAVTKATIADRAPEMNAAT